jgi:hypothetical protein
MDDKGASSNILIGLEVIARFLSIDKYYPGQVEGVGGY